MTSQKQEEMNRLKSKKQNKSSLISHWFENLLQIGRFHKWPISTAKSMKNFVMDTAYTDDSKLTLQSNIDRKK